MCIFMFPKKKFPNQGRAEGGGYSETFYLPDVWVHPKEGEKKGSGAGAVKMGTNGQKMGKNEKNGKK